MRSWNVAIECTRGRRGIRAPRSKRSHKSSDFVDDVGIVREGIGLPIETEPQGLGLAMDVYVRMV